MSDDRGPRSRRTIIGYSALALAVAVVASIALYSIYGTSSAAPGVARTVTVTRGTVQESVSASGNTSAVTSASDDFDSSGTLTSVNVNVGDQVTAGEVLATIDPAQAQANLKSAEASLATCADHAGSRPGRGHTGAASPEPGHLGVLAATIDQRSKPIDRRPDELGDRAVRPQL